ncbi:hypothetical protein FS749_000141 [Ceratobasidium sp. UAMH 11750]|nr:hypothetical protein FS749_000141 [Ceratobasidium sp. UAMH 11750]
MSGPSRPNYSRASQSSASMGGGWRAKLAKVKDYVVSSEVSKTAYNAVSNRVVAYRTGVDPTTGEKRQTWEEWARERRQRRREEQRGAERIALFPGWAVRRYPDTRPLTKAGDVQQFAIEVFVSGFASSLRTPEQATRSQRAFMSIARSFSALPKLPPPPENILGGPGSATPFTQSPNPSADDLAEELARMGVVLPPRPEDITEETETRTLNAQTQPKVERTRDARIVDYGATTPRSGLSTPTPESSSSNSRPQLPLAPGRSPVTQVPPAFKNERSNTASSATSVFSAGSTHVTSIHPNMDVGILRQLHANLDTRLQPFWSNKLENRTVRVSLYAQSPDVVTSHGRAKSQPLASACIQTSAQGYFAHVFNITFEQLCTHDQALHIAFGNHSEEHPLYVHAQLLPMVNAPDSSGPGAQITKDIGVASESSGQSNGSVQAQGEVRLSCARVRVISDIDDTVKISEVLMGVRAIFHNVFVRHLDELVVPGMPELYAKLAARGVGFHYVSNGPYELLPVLLDFFGISNLPKGSVKLKSYGGRSLFQGLWGESAADRKRGNVVEVLDSFPGCKFILVGDTGEQDLELYSVLAQERPHQIIALFLRDVTPPTPPPTAPPTPSLDPVPDRTIKKQGSAGSLRSIRSLTGGGKKPKDELPKLQISQASQSSTGFKSTRSVARSATDPAQSSPSTPYRVYTPRTRGSSGSYFDGPTPVAKRPELPPVPSQFVPASQNLGVDPAGALVSAAATAGTGHSADTVADNTRAGILAKKEALRLRLEAAKARVPAHIILRVFREPSECEDEAVNLLDTLENRG